MFSVENPCFPGRVRNRQRNLFAGGAVDTTDRIQAQPLFVADGQQGSAPAGLLSYLLPYFSGVPFICCFPRGDADTGDRVCTHAGNR